MTTTQDHTFHPAAGPGIDSSRVEHFRAKLRFETDPSDVHAALESGDADFVLIDTRGEAAWGQGRIPGAVHLPTADIATRAAELLDPAVPVVTYCWGPGCNGSTRAALALALLGYDVREMIGGFEYWAREGLPVRTDTGTTRRTVDGLTAPLAVNLQPVACDC